MGDVNKCIMPGAAFLLFGHETVSMCTTKVATALSFVRTQGSILRENIFDTILQLHLGLCHAAHICQSAEISIAVHAPLSCCNMLHLNQPRISK